jgi:hypothetical protein
MDFGDLLLRNGERPARIVNARYLIHLIQEQLSLRYVQITHDKL